MGRIALVFSGQGAQMPGMGKDFYEAYPLVRDYFSRAETVHTGLTDLCFNSSAETLALTIHTQPCMYVYQMAVAALFAGDRLPVDFVAGFSLGEVSAIAYAGGFDFISGLKYIIERAGAMDEAASTNPGSMAAVLKVDEQLLTQICARFEDVWPVNFNAPGQIVISGKTSAVHAVMKVCSEMGKRAVLLPVSGAFHSPYMQKASRRVQAYLETVETGNLCLPVYSNTLGSELPNNQMKEFLASQISSPVLWRQQIESMIRDGADIFIETGPGNVLTSLIRKINSSVRVISIQSAEDYKKLIEFMNNGKEVSLC